LLVAVVSMLAVTWVYRDLDHLLDHLNSTGSVQLGSWWLALVGVVTPAALIYVLVDELRAVLEEPYGGYPDWLINWIGWGSAALVIGVALVLARLPWRRTVDLSAPSKEGSR
jgi:NSS family neurotransmitter:Na+ symporter